MRRNRIKLDDPDPLRQLWLQLALLFCTLAAGLWWSFAYLSESWTCISLGSDCFQFRKTLNCQAVPFQADFRSSEVSATLTCPWERGTAEVRICVLASAMGLYLQAIYGVRMGRKQLVQSVTQCLCYLPLFLALVTTFDVLGVAAAGDVCDQLRGVMGAGECKSSIASYTAFVCGISTVLTLLVRRGLKSWEALQPLDDL